MQTSNSISHWSTHSSPAWLLLSIMDSAGIMRAKSIPLNRADYAANIGIRAPDWAFFAIDNVIATTSPLLPIGEHWLKPELNAIKQLDEHLFWAPSEIYMRDGKHAFWCARHFLRKQCDRLQSLDIDVKTAGEIEFTLLPEGASTGSNWQAYGLNPLLSNEGFSTDVMDNFARLGMGIEQFHAEHGQYQFELSLTPRPPIEAMDNIVLARIELGRIARKHGLKISFSPKPYLDNAGNGAHLHFSFFKQGSPLLASRSEEENVISPTGKCMIGGIVHYLPEMLALLAPSVLSRLRLQPGLWSGAYACWGVENREAAVRYCEADNGEPDSAHIEVKCIDPSANPYLACATILAMAYQGIYESMPLPQGINVAPDSLSENERACAGIMRLDADQRRSLEQLENSALANGILPSEWLNALIAVRRHELATYGQLSDEEAIRLLRFAWST